nr:hypothetical protein HK105_000129 [Polyrhizophydium stewartii]
MNLRVLSVSRNRISLLPKYVASMSSLQVLKLDQNPFIWPPPRLLQCESEELEKQWLEGVKSFLVREDPPAHLLNQPLLSRRLGQSSSQSSSAPLYHPATAASGALPPSGSTQHPSPALSAHVDNCSESIRAYFVTTPMLPELLLESESAHAQNIAKTFLLAASDLYAVVQTMLAHLSRKALANPAAAATSSFSSVTIERDMKALNREALAMLAFMSDLDQQTLQLHVAAAQRRPAESTHEMRAQDAVSTEMLKHLTQRLAKRLQAVVGTAASVLVPAIFDGSHPDKRLVFMLLCDWHRANVTIAAAMQLVHHALLGSGVPSSAIAAAAAASSSASVSAAPLSVSLGQGHHSQMLSILSAPTQAPAPGTSVSDPALRPHSAMSSHSHTASAIASPSAAGTTPPLSYLPPPAATPGVPHRAATVNGRPNLSVVAMSVRHVRNRSTSSVDSIDVPPGEGEPSSASSRQDQLGAARIAAFGFGTAGSAVAPGPTSASLASSSRMQMATLGGGTPTSAGHGIALPRSRSNSIGSASMPDLTTIGHGAFDLLQDPGRSSTTSGALAAAVASAAGSLRAATQLQLQQHQQQQQQQQSTPSQQQANQLVADLARLVDHVRRVCQSASQSIDAATLLERADHVESAAQSLLGQMHHPTGPALAAAVKTLVRTAAALSLELRHQTISAAGLAELAPILPAAARALHGAKALSSALR